MEQVELYLNGQLDYVQLKGRTGPLVYPAGHVYVYSWLYRITNEGKDIVTAQCVFTGVYLVTLAVVFAVYIKAKVCPFFCYCLEKAYQRLKEAARYLLIFYHS